jgi:hypothetical protein
VTSAEFRSFDHDLTMFESRAAAWNLTPAKDDGTKPEVPDNVAKLEPPPGASLEVVAQIADEEYKRPTEEDQRATATIPAEAWGEPVDGLRVAIVLRSPPINEHQRLSYYIVAENVSDHDIRFGATLDLNASHNFSIAKLVDADDKQVALQAGTVMWLRPTFIRLWLKPKERGVIASCATHLFKADEAGKPIGTTDGDRSLTPTTRSTRRVDTTPSGSTAGYRPTHFSVMPGRYSVSAAVTLGSSRYSVDPVSKKRTVLSPAKGEWSGKLQTGAVPVSLFTDSASVDKAPVKQPPTINSPKK